MIIDAIPFIDTYNEGEFKKRAMRSFIEFLERRLGASVIQSARNIPYGRADLIEPLHLAELLKRKNVVTDFGPVIRFPDEPPLKLWYAGYQSAFEGRAGGASFESDEEALMAALAEALERYIWSQTTDYFRDPLQAPAREMEKRDFIDPRRFTGFSEKQRQEHEGRRFDETTRFLWIKGDSLVTGKHTYIPAQTASGTADSIMHKEPLIRDRNTTGLATWGTRKGAQLAGALEVIERDAHMIMWLNQLTLPRISNVQIKEMNGSLTRLIDVCEQYRLIVHVIQLITDAPAHAVCVLMEDVSGCAPRFAFGIRAHRSLSYAVEKAALEALRARLLYRQNSAEKERWDPDTPAEKIGHLGRSYYWGEKRHAHKLEFLIRGTEKEVAPAPWEGDTPEQHLARIIAWCKTKGYECVSVPLGISSLNPTSLCIESVVIPELQPMHLSERFQLLGGSRWKEVPELFGLTPRSEPFSAEPHPFV